MAGNRQRQRAFKIPVLLEVATLGGRVDASRYGRDKSEGVADLVGWVLAYYSFSAAERKERHKKSGQLVLENDIRWSADQLEDQGLLARRKNEFWEITDSGLTTIRDYLALLLRRKLTDDEVDELMMERNYNDEELLLQVLKMIAQNSIHLPTDSLAITVLAGDSLRHVFRNSVSNLPLHEVSNFVCYGYEVIKPFVSRDLATRHGLRAAA
jgi:restriction endonuclease Mrr